MFLFRWLRKLYDWTMKWADSRYAVAALCIVAFAESSFFPIPPDVLLIAMCLAVPKKSFWYSAYTSVMSILGGIGGFLIGYGLMNAIGYPIIDFYNLRPLYLKLSEVFKEFNFLAVFTAALTPIPYKVFTITAGAVAASPAISGNVTGFFTVFLIASILGRSLRFFAVGTLIYFFGEKVKAWIDKYFNWISVAFVALVAIGFVIMKYAV